MEFKAQNNKSSIDKLLQEYFSFDRIEYYGQNEFEGGGEETLILISGQKEEFKELITFWIKCKQKIIHLEDNFDQDNHDLENYDVTLLSIDIKDINEKLRTEYLRLKTEIKLIDKITNVYQISSDWNLQVFILENKERYMLFSWETTA